MMVDAAKNFIYDFQLFCDATGGEFTDENMDKKINILNYLFAKTSKYTYYSWLIQDVSKSKVQHLPK